MTAFDGLPLAHFGAVLCDPPWHFKRYSEKATGKCRAPQDHYATMTAQEMAALPVTAVAAESCALFMWTTWPHLPQAMALIDAWGFTYKTCGFDWMKADGRSMDLFDDTIKAAIRMGYWTRSNSEPCLLATRGKPKRRDAGVRMGIIEPSRQHSRKPDCVYGRIERLVAGPYLELFARNTRHGWTSWGNETGLFRGT